jgi:DNA polymerase-3 subunit alpha
MDNNMEFTHLHVHTEYSLLDGSSKIKELVAQTKKLGMDSIAITDHGVMYGVIDFYKAAKEIGIKPIIGCEVYVAPGSRFIKDSKQDDRYFHLVLLAENDQGYSNLMKLVSNGFTEGFYYKPRIDFELIEKYHEGIIALSACLGGELPSLLRSGRYNDAKEIALKYQSVFGSDNYFLELQDHGYPEQKTVNQQLIKLSKETGIKLVATNDSHYTYKEDEQAHDILLCIQTNKKVDDVDRMRYEGGQFYLKSPEEMYKLFPYATDALRNTHDIAERCNVEIEFGVTKLPEFDVPEGYNATTYLEKLCYEGLAKRYGNKADGLKDRLVFELDVISKMGYVDYFLIVWDFIKYARDNDIAVGPGRGSAAGSIVSYCLGITNIDPLKYNLLFERFLNPERVSMPDIDIDFCYVRRQEVIDYVVRKYGTDRVVQIVTFGTMAARGVIRDVARALDVPYADADRVAKMIPFEIGITIDKALKINKELNDAYENDPRIKYLIDMSRRLEGLPRHTSMHAAGVVISKKSVDEYVPLAISAGDDAVTTQFTMNTLEELGLLKMDFLGLRTLTVIQDACKLIEKSTCVWLDLDTMEYNDDKVFELIGSGRTEGIFQLESAGMKSFMKELKPKSLEDIIAGISLYRPGPMDFIPRYLSGKNDASSIRYDCPQLEEILSTTYGCIVYQEQVMQIVRDLAGYTLGRSDSVRRAMSKKKTEVMAKERQYFVYGNEEMGVKGCVANGISETVANKIFDEMTDFAKYAFNKSHAAAYAVVAYQTAYLKYYYPVEFMAALMTSVMDNSGKVSEYMLASKQMGIKLLPPDINEGYSVFSVSDNAIRYGLSAIKNVGRVVIDAIVKERQLNGNFPDLENFIERMAGKDLNKRSIESFIKAGALDSLEGTRKQFMQVYALILDNINQTRKKSMEGQFTLFDFVDEEEKKDYAIKFPDVGEYPKQEMLNFEKEVLGIYVSGHPLEDYERTWRAKVSATTLDFQMDEETGETKLVDGSKQIIGGIVTGKTVKSTKTGKMMAFVTVEDLVGTVEVVIFPKDYEKYLKYLNEDEKIYVTGRVSVQEEQQGKLICEKIVSFEEIGNNNSQRKNMQNSLVKQLWLQFENKQQYEDIQESLYEDLSSYNGNDDIFIYCKAEKQLSNIFKTGINDSLVKELAEKLGISNVKVVEKIK